MQEPDDDDALRGRYDMGDAHHAGIGCLTLLLLIIVTFGVWWLIFEAFIRITRL
jgi:hypothetical protein